MMSVKTSRSDSCARGRWIVCAGLLAVLLAPAGPVRATETEFWVTDTASEFLKGRGDGVAVDASGHLFPVPAWQTEVAFEEPVVLAGDMAPDGTIVVGTGHPAHLYRVRKGAAELLSEVPAEQITAVLADGDGSVVVATMSPGALFRWDGDELAEIGRLGEGGFWDLARFDGRIIAAAGPPASLYRVGPQGLERWVELPDAFVRCLEVLPDRVVAGTSGKGLILSVDSEGRQGLLLDSQFTEISDLVAVPDGSLWATALVGEPPPKKSKGDSENGKDEGETQTGTVNLDLPKVNGATATSELIQLTPDGGMLRMHRWVRQVASAVTWDGSGVLVGTGYEGELWRFVPSGGARLATVDAVQAVAILDGGAAVLTQGPAHLLRREGQAERARFRSDTLNLQWPAHFGRFSVMPPGEGVRIRFRSGVSKEPDPTWLPWSEWLEFGAEAVPLPAARSLQWELEIDADERPERAVERVDVAYREINLEPLLYPVEVEEPGVIYLPGPPPSGPVIDVANPDASGIFTVIHDDMGRANGANNKGKKYWRVGYRTVSWKAEDPNKDPLLFALEMERSDGYRLPVKDRLKLTQMAVDTTAVPDGRYRFRVSASDAETNPGDGHQVSSVSPWIVVDNTPPKIVLERDGGSWTIRVEDALSPISRVEWSRDGEDWQTVAPRDGLLDSPHELFQVAAAEGRHLLVVRAVDAQHNRATAGGVEGGS